MRQWLRQQMRQRIRKLSLRLRRAGGVDIVLTHAPARGYGDVDTPSHRGFEAFLPLLDKYRPAYLIHGHVHKNYSAHSFQREIRYGDTTILNAAGRTILEL